MEYSKDKVTSYVLKCVGQDNLGYLNDYVQEIVTREFVSFDKEDDVREFFKGNLEELYSVCSSKDIDLLRYYTGIAYRDINAILRGNWNYQDNGILTTEKRKDCFDIAQNISSTICKMGELPNNISVYRGVSIESFRRFGVSSLEELISLKGQFIYEQGFSSTSLIREKSFFNRPLEYHNQCNIEIQYLVPQESMDGVPLIDYDTSYSTVQSEYLINSSSLLKVVDVQIDRDNNLAYLKVVLLPRREWDKSYEQVSGRSK